MSSDSLAAFRKGLSDDLSKLARQHLQDDLQQSDRDALRSASRKVSSWASFGSLLGLGVGVALAYRLRINRRAMFEAFRATQKPTHVKLADGREEAIPDLTPLLSPTTVGDFAAFTFFSVAGLFLGGETGLLVGSFRARRSILKDPETSARIETAYRGFRADMLRKEADMLESGRGGSGLGW